MAKYNFDLSMINANLLYHLRWHGRQVEVNKQDDVYEQILLKCFRASADQQEFTTFNFKQSEREIYEGYVERLKQLKFDAYIEGDSAREWLVVSWD